MHARRVRSAHQVEMSGAGRSTPDRVPWPLGLFLYPTPRSSDCVLTWEPGIEIRSPHPSRSNDQILRRISGSDAPRYGRVGQGLPQENRMLGRCSTRSSRPGGVAPGLISGGGSLVKLNVP